MTQASARGGILNGSRSIKVKIPIGTMARKNKPEFLTEKFLNEAGKGRSITAFDDPAENAVKRLLASGVEV